MSSPSSVAAYAVIPIKSFERGKTRLRERLDETARRELARTMFEHVLESSLRCARLAGVLVLTDADDIAAFARARGAAVLTDRAQHESADETPGHLARVVDAGLVQLRDLGADDALVLMADLPRVQTADLEQMLDALARHDLVLAPDARRQCTNALALRLEPAAQFQTGFGSPGSLAVHESRARSLGLRVAVVSNPRLALDVDVPTDLDL